MRCRRQYAPFYPSSHASGFCAHSSLRDSSEPQHKAHCKAIEAHKLIITYLSGGWLHLSAVKVEDAVRCVADAVALAELYDILPEIVESISRDVRQVVGLWDDIASDPQFYAALGIKLRDTVILSEAIRHLAAVYPKIGKLPDNDIFDADDLLSIIVEKAFYLKYLSWNVYGEVHRLAPRLIYSMSDDHRGKLLLESEDGQQSKERAKFVARGILSQYLNKHVLNKRNKQIINTFS